MSETKNEIPIRYGKYIDHDMNEQKVIFIGAEKAIYDSDGTRLDNKILTMKEDMSDAFVENKYYAAGDYCIYLNRLYKFTQAKAAGPWDGAAVIPVTLSQEISDLRGEVEVLNSNLDDRNPIPDLLAEADNGLNSKRIVNCNGDTLNTPYADGLTGTAKAGIAYINMTSKTHGTILYIVSSTFNGITRMFLRPKTSGTWGEWMLVTSNPGTNKLLWSGSWSSGSITVPDFDKYTIFRITMEGQGTDIIASKHTTFLRGIGGYVNPNGDRIYLYSLSATINNNELTYLHCYLLDLSKDFAPVEQTISGIYGLC